MAESGGLFRISAEQRELAVPATGEPAVLAVRVMNTSAIVDGYAVDLPSAPEWLEVESGQIRLLPGTEDALPIWMRIVSATLVPAQQLRLTLRIRSLSQVPAHSDLPVLITVPVVDVPVRLHAEPSLLRVRDRDTATCTIVVDNSSSNHPVQLRFAGSDPKLAVRFRFEPPVLQVGPAASGSILVSLTAAIPEPGQEITRPVTVTAIDGSRRAGTVITFQQSASALPMSTLGVRIEPSMVRVQDASSERWPLARLLLTLFGALAMILGALLPWRAVSDQRGVDLDVDTFAQAFGFSINMRGAEFVISAGLMIMGLALLMIFGVGGRSGRLSRVAALLGALLVIGTFVAVALAGGNIMPARGAILVFAGCIAGYIGGLLVKRRSRGREHAG